MEMLNIESEEEENQKSPDEDSDPNFYVSNSGNDTFLGTSEAAPYKTLAKAYEAALADAQRKRIVILTNLSEPELVTFNPSDKLTNGDAPILIMGKTAALKIERSAGADDSVLEISGGAKIIFKNITINGKGDGPVYRRALAVGGNGTTVTFENEVVITGKKNSGEPNVTNVDQHDSGIRVYDQAHLVMKGNSQVTECMGTTQCRGAIMIHLD
jgi:hypothetical protein